MNFTHDEIISAGPKSGHSEKLLTADRDYWFNHDFLELMAKRWQLNRYSSLLDVGAGLCHWSKLLVPYMIGKKQVVALDSDEKWAQGNDEIRSFFSSHNADIDFVQGDAHLLPFPDQSFDVVTCQTLLIHVQNPVAVLREMKRVAKPNGIVICSEPNNRIQALLQDTSNKDEDMGQWLQRVRQNLNFEKRKAKQNMGNQSFGDLLAGTMNELGFNNIQCFLNDKLVCIFPPYQTREQQLKINSYLKWGKDPSEIETFDSAYENAVQKGGYTEFLKKHTPSDTQNKVIKGLKQQTFASGGASLLYLISGN